MRKRMRKHILGVVTLLTLLFCLGISDIQAEAAGPRDGEIVDGSLLTSDLEASDKFENVQRGSFLAMGMSMISNRGNGLIYIGGDTICHRTCDKVKMYLYLERLVGDYWEPVTQKTKTEKDIYFAGNEAFITVEKGSYYRVKGSHSAIYQNDSESCYTVTNGLYID